MKFPSLPVLAALFGAAVSLTAADPAAAPAATPAPVEHVTPAAAPAATPAPVEQPAAPVKDEPVPELTEADLKEPESPTAAAYRAHRPVKVLVLTSNYETPMFLANAARLEKNVPVVVAPAGVPVPGPETRLWFYPGGKEPGFPLLARDLAKLIAYLRPVNVAALGDENYLPPVYLKAVPAECRLESYDDPSWVYNALRLGNRIDSRKLLPDYEAYRTAKAAEAVRERTAAARAAAAR